MLELLKESILRKGSKNKWWIQAEKSPPIQKLKRNKCCLTAIIRQSTVFYLKIISY